MKKMKNIYECDNPNVNPNHYKTASGIETIEVLDAFTDGLNGIEAVCTANALKYLCRWKKKNGVEDLNKAIWYIQYLINKLSKDEEEPFS